MSNEPSNTSIKEIISRRGEPALARWRNIIERVIASNAEASPVDVADLVVQAEEERGIYEALEQVNKERQAFRLLEAIHTMDRHGGKMSVTDIVRDARGIIEGRITPPPPPGYTKVQPYPYTNVYVDVKIVQPSDWATGQLCAVIELPAPIHDQSAHISNLDLERWNRNPVVCGVGGLQELPIGGGHGWVSKLSPVIELTIQLADRESNKPMSESLMSGEKRFVANVILTNSTGSEWAGELLAIEVVSAPHEE